jgi:hypothetical protein
MRYVRHPGAPHVAVAVIADTDRIVEELVRELRHWPNLSDGVPVGSLRNEPAIVTFQKNQPALQWRAKNRQYRQLLSKQAKTRSLYAGPYWSAKTTQIALSGHQIASQLAAFVGLERSSRVQPTFTKESLSAAAG